MEMKVDSKDPVSSAQSQLAHGLMKLSLALRHHGHAVGFARRLSPLQLQILSLLTSRAPAALSPSHIARELAVTQPTVSDAIGALVHKKLVRKNASKQDMRSCCVLLTAKGRKVSDSLTLWPDALARTIAELSEAEAATMTRVVLKMIRQMQLDGLIPLARMCASCLHFRPFAHASEQQPHHCALVDAPLGDSQLRVDCPEHCALPEGDAKKVWSVFINGKSIAGDVPAKGRC